MEKRSFRSVPARLALLALAMLGAALLSLCLGAAAVSPREILSVLSGGGKGTTAASILLYVRLPRTLGCLLAGAALAVAGLAAEGVTTVQGIGHIQRGYADLAGDLRALGARITAQ